MSNDVPSKKELMAMDEEQLMLLVKGEVEVDMDRFTNFVMEAVKRNELLGLEQLLTVLKGLLRHTHPDSDEFDHYDHLCGVVWERTLGHMVRVVGEA